MKFILEDIYFYILYVIVCVMGECFLIIYGKKNTEKIFTKILILFDILFKGYFND